MEDERRGKRERRVKKQEVEGIKRGRREGEDRIHSSLDVTNIIESRGSHVNDELLDG